MNAKILVINGSLGGSRGNTASLLAPLQSHLENSVDGSCEVRTLHLRDSISAENQTPFLGSSHDALIMNWTEQIRWADGFVFATGTYWDSWGSPLQLFFELMTSTEGSDAWIGKPAMCIVCMHSVGGKEVLARLQSALNCFGLLIPPMTGMAHSMVGQETLRSPLRDSSFDRDIWSLDDLESMSANLLSVARARLHGHLKFTAWPVDRDDPSRLWLHRG